MSQPTSSSPAKAGDPVLRDVSDNDERLGVLDTPLEPVIGRAEGETRWRGMTVLALAALIALTSPAAAGTWKYEIVKNDGHELTYIEDGKVTFYLGCGRFFALQVKYPGEAKEEGKARITISAAKQKMTLDGEFVPNVKAEVPVPMDFATEFAQTYLGYAKNDPRVYGKRWLALRSRFYTLLGSGEPLTIAAGKSSYQLPPIDAANWRKPFERCGLGDSW